VGVGIGGGYSGVQFLDLHMFILVICSSSTLLLVTKVLYQQAISSSPLSLTVPYLALTPAFLVGTAFVLVGEQPTTIGLTGVVSELVELKQSMLRR
jgi:drug/metabolite transporter (DMT)-like permease